MLPTAGLGSTAKVLVVFVASSPSPATISSPDYFCSGEVSFHSWGGDQRRAGRGDLPGLGFSFCFANPQMGNPLGDPRGLAGCHLYVAKCDGPSLEEADPKRRLAWGTGAPSPALWGLLGRLGRPDPECAGAVLLPFLQLGVRALSPLEGWSSGRQASSCSGINRQVYPSQPLLWLKAGRLWGEILSVPPVAYLGSWGSDQQPPPLGRETTCP